MVGHNDYPTERPDQSGASFAGLIILAGAGSAFRAGAETGPSGAHGEAMMGPMGW